MYLFRKSISQSTLLLHHASCVFSSKVEEAKLQVISLSDKLADEFIMREDRIATHRTIVTDTLTTNWKLRPARQDLE